MKKVIILFLLLQGVAFGETINAIEMRNPALCVLETIKKDGNCLQHDCNVTGETTIRCKIQCIYQQCYDIGYCDTKEKLFTICGEFK